MAIYCRKCGYEMSRSEAVGSLSPEICKFIINTLEPYISLYFLKRSFSIAIDDFYDGLFIYELNKQSIPCHRCMQFIGWSTEREQNQSIKAKEWQLR